MGMDRDPFDPSRLGQGVTRWAALTSGPTKAARRNGTSTQYWALEGRIEAPDTFP